MPHAHRHHRALRKNPPASPAAVEYMITDVHHKPDLNGEFAGQKVYRKGIAWYVRLTPNQAKFYLASGAIKIEAPPKHVSGPVKDQSPSVH